jgi:hypothetical protein
MACRPAVGGHFRRFKVIDARKPARLLPPLEQLQRQYLHKRIAEEHAPLDHLSMRMKSRPTLTNERPLAPRLVLN